MPVLVQPPVHGLSHPLSCLQLYDETGHIGLLVCTASDLLDLTCLLLQPPGYLRGPALSSHPQ